MLNGLGRPIDYALTEGILRGLAFSAAAFSWLFFFIALVTTIT
jgi:hypothetical protein